MLFFLAYGCVDVEESNLIYEVTYDYNDQFDKTASIVCADGSVIHSTCYIYKWNPQPLGSCTPIGEIILCK